LSIVLTIDSQPSLINKLIELRPALIMQLDRWTNSWPSTERIIMKILFFLFIITFHTLASAESFVKCFGSGNFQNVLSYDIPLETTSQSFQNILLANEEYISELLINRSHRQKPIRYKNYCLQKRLLWRSHRRKHCG